MFKAKHRQTGGAHTRVEDHVTDRIIGCAIEVHKSLGPGLLESAFNVPVLKDGIKRVVNNY